MTISKTLRRIKQLTQQDKTPLLGNIIMRDIHRGTEQRIRYLTRNISSKEGNPCVYINPGIARNQYARELLEQNLAVRFTFQPSQSLHKEEMICDVYLDEKLYEVHTNLDPVTVENLLRREIKVLNDIGFNLEYAGQYVPPDA